MTDAAHLLSDAAGFAISLFALYAAAFPRSRRFNFGWHRAEVVGALGSILVRMIAEEKVIMIFVVSTGWTVLAMVRIAMMNYTTNWEKSMRPLDIEGGTMTIFL